MFKKAERKQARLRLALTGPSGAGKTYSALLIAKGLGGKIAVIDTERSSASLYSNIVDFDVCELEPPYSPDKFIEAIQEAEKAGYDTLILDSITHEWNGVGGVLEMVDNAAASSRSGNSYVAWNGVSQKHQKFIEALLASPMDIIVTMRSKTAYELVDTDKGKKAPKKMGMAPQQRDGIEYEFTTVLDISIDKHMALASKDRTEIFKEPFLITEDTGKLIKDWLQKGTPQQDKPKATQEEIDRIMKLGNILMAKNNQDKPAMYREATDFFGREIKSLKDDLSPQEVKEMLEALEVA